MILPALDIQDNRSRLYSPKEVRGGQQPNPRLPAPGSRKKVSLALGVILLFVGACTALVMSAERVEAATYDIPRDCGSQPYACYGKVTYSNFADGWVIQNRKAHGCLRNSRFDDWDAAFVDYQYVNGDWEPIQDSLHLSGLMYNEACYRMTPHTRDQITSGLASAKVHFEFRDLNGPTDMIIEFSCDLQFAGEPHRCYQILFLIR